MKKLILFVAILLCSSLVAFGQAKKPTIISRKLAQIRTRPITARMRWVVLFMGLYLLGVMGIGIL